MKWECTDVTVRLTPKQVQEYLIAYRSDEVAFYEKLRARFDKVVSERPLEGRKVAIVSFPEEIEMECINVIQLLAGKDRDEAKVIAYARSIDEKKLSSDISFLCSLARDYKAGVVFHMGSFHGLEEDCE
jgi:hypothetical protein